MILKSISIKNIGAHRDTRIEFDKLDSIVAITGQNGSGKTFLLESIPAIFYGAFPTRPGSLYDRITKGYKGLAEMEVEFEFGGKAYRAVRRLKNSTKTGKAEGELFCNGEAIAGPKVEDFERAIQVLLGDQATFLASVYSSQRNTGDLCDARPAERKAIFGTMLGLARFDSLSELAKDKFEDACQSEDLLRRELGPLQSEIDRLRKEADMLPSLEVDLVLLEKREVEVAGKIDELQAELSKASSDMAQAALLKKQRAVLQAEISDLERRIVALRRNIETQKMLLETADQVKAEAANLKELREIEANLAADSEAFHQAQTKIAQIEGRISTLESKEAILKKQAGLLGDIPNEEICRSCVLARAAYEAQDKLSGISNEVVQSQQELTATRVPAYDRGRHDEVRKKLRSLQDSEKKMADIARAEGVIHSLETELIDKQADRGTKEAQLEANTRECEALCFDPLDVEKVKNAFTTLKSEQTRLQESKAGLNQKIGRCKHLLSEIGEKDARAEKIAVEIENLAKGSKVHQILAKAFGRSGIQPLIIDSARPRFESIADELLQMATDGRMQIRFETQKTLKSGDVSESLDIIITRDGIEQDIAEFSGGEQKLIKTIIRLTLAIYQATHSGRKLRTVFIDEIFDDLDADNSQRLLVVLGKLRDYFEKIIVISHNDELLTTLPSRVNLRKGNSGTEVEII